MGCLDDTAGSGRTCPATLLSYVKLRPSGHFQAVSVIWLGATVDWLTFEGTSPIASRAPAASRTIPGDPAPDRPHRAHSRQPDPQPNHQAALDRPNSAPPTADAIRQYPATEQQALHLMEAPKPEPAEQPPQKSSRPAAPMLIWRQRPRLQRMQIRDSVYIQHPRSWGGEPTAALDRRPEEEPGGQRHRYQGSGKAPIDHLVGYASDRRRAAPGGDGSQCRHNHERDWPSSRRSRRFVPVLLYCGIEGCRFV